MIKIVSILKPFEYNQHIYIVEDGDTIETTECTLDNMSEIIYALCDKYQTEQVDIACGSKEFSKKIGDKINQFCISKYAENKLEINYI